MNTKKLLFALFFVISLTVTISLFSCVDSNDGNKSKSESDGNYSIAPLDSSGSASITTEGTTALSTTTSTSVTTSVVTTPPVTTPPVTTSITTASIVQPPIPTQVTIQYVSSNTSMGTISGITKQTITTGVNKTSSVTAKANLGYKFVSWSDGNKSATRNAESPVKNDTITANFTVDALELPVLMLTTSTGTDVTSKEEYIDGTISVLNTDESYLLDSLAMQIRGRGNYSWDSTFKSDPLYNKRAYRIKLSEKQALTGIGEGKSKNWVLLADHCDQSLLRNNIVYTFAGMLSGIEWQPHVQSVEVFINGEYHGVYLLCEQVDVNSNKISVSEDISNTSLAFLIMYSGYTDTSSFYSFKVNGQKYEIKSNLSENSSLSSSQKNYIVSYVTSCWTAVANGSEEQISKLIDIDSVIDTYIVHELFKNLDTGWDNFYMYKDIDGLLHFGPVWDFDQCAGNADCDVDNYENLRGGNEQPWYKTLLNCSWFKQRLQQRWYEIKEDLIDTIPQMIIDAGEGGYNSYCRNFIRWPIFGYKINRETYVRSFTTYKEHYEYFSQFMTDRIAWLDSYWGDIDFAFNGKLALGGEGSVISPYLLSSEADFINFTLCCLNGNKFENKYFLQTADIDLAGFYYYKGMGSVATFSGIYNGNGYTINVDITNSASIDNDGCVFPYVTGVVMNVVTTGTINNTGITGGIARSVRSTGAIINCASYINISSQSNAGGIVASNQNGAGISNCYFGGVVKSVKSASPINVWYSGRAGRFNNNYYIATVTHDTVEININREEIAVNTVSEDIAAKLNAGLSSALSGISGISIDKLCSWSFSSGVLILNHK